MLVNWFLLVVFLDTFVLTQSGFSLSPVSTQFLYLCICVHVCISMIAFQYACCRNHFTSSIIYSMVLDFAETFLFKLWSHCHICYPWDVYSFCCYWTSGVSFSLVNLSIYFVFHFPHIFLIHMHIYFLISYLGGLMYLMYRLPFVECLMFGALISATDPVTVLSIFQVILCSTFVSNTIICQQVSILREEKIFSVQGCASETPHSGSRECH